MTDRDGLLRGVVGRTADVALGLPKANNGYEVQRDLAVPMPDGVCLLGDLYRPTGASGPRPVVLIRLPYGRAALNGLAFGATFARHGHQVFIQSTRGTFGSGGHFRPFSTEREDGLATLEWVREQAWCDGRVAMTGGSYFGHTQWAVAPYADPPLVSFAPHVTSARITRPFYEGGAPAILNSLAWTEQLGRQERGILAQLPTPVRAARLRRAVRALPLQAADVAVNGTAHPFWRDFVEHAEPTDDFWAGTDHSTVDMNALPPATAVTGWWDLFLPGQLADVTALRAAGNDMRLVIGPWLHGEPGELKAMLVSDIAWLDHQLGDGPAPDGAPFRVALQNTDAWLELEEWPPSEAVPETLHLHADRTLQPDPATAPAEPSRFVYDPTDPTPSVGGPLLKGPGKQVDNRDIERRGDVLVFTGSPLEADLDIVGDVSARIHVRHSVSHADVFVRICDVDEKGRSLNVVDGIRRLHPNTVPADDVRVGDDGVLTVDVPLFPTAYRVVAGHRLRVQVSAGAFPRYARNLGTGDPLATGRDGVPCHVEIFHDAERPSSVTLRRMPWPEAASPRGKADAANELQPVS